MTFGARSISRSCILAPSLFALALAIPATGAAQSEEAGDDAAPSAAASEDSSDTSASSTGTRSRDYSTREDRSWAGQAIRGSAPTYHSESDRFVYPTGTQVRGTDPSGEVGTVNEKGDIVYSDGTRVVHDPVTGAVTYVHPDGGTTQAGGVTYDSSRNIFIFEDGPHVSGTDNTGQRAKVNEKGDVVGADGSFIVYDANTNETTFVAPNGDATVRGADGSETTYGTTRYPRSFVDERTGIAVEFGPGESRQETGDSKYNPDTGRYDNPDGSSSDTAGGSSGDRGSSSTASSRSGGERRKGGSSGGGSNQQAGSGGGSAKDSDTQNDSKSDSKDAKDSKSASKDDDAKNDKKDSKSDGGSKGYTPMAGMDNGGRRPATWSRTDHLCNRKGRFSARCPGAASQPGQQDQKTAATGPVLGVRGKGVGIPQAGQQGQKKSVNARKGWTIDPGDQAKVPSTRGRKPTDKRGWTVDPGEQSGPKRQISEEELERRLEERRSWAMGREGF